MYLEKDLEKYAKMIFWLYRSIHSRWGGSFIGNLFNNTVNTYKSKLNWNMLGCISGLYKCIYGILAFTGFRDATIAIEWYVRDYKTPFYLLQWMFRVFDHKGR